MYPTSQPVCNCSAPSFYTIQISILNLYSRWNSSPNQFSPAWFEHDPLIRKSPPSLSRGPQPPATMISGDDFVKHISAECLRTIREQWSRTKNDSSCLFPSGLRFSLTNKHGHVSRKESLSKNICSLQGHAPIPRILLSTLRTDRPLLKPYHNSLFTRADTIIKSLHKEKLFGPFWGIIDVCKMYNHTFAAQEARTKPVHLSKVYSSGCGYSGSINLFQENPW